MDVTVAIPSIRPEAVDRAVESVLADDPGWLDTEIIVAADGWAEGDAAGGADAVIEVPPTNNAPMSRNRIMEEADGDYIAVLDDDDVWVGGRFEAQYDLLERGGYDMVGSLASAVPTRGHNPHGDYTTLEGGSLIAHSSVMYGSEWRYREKFALANDYDLWLRMATSGASVLASWEPWCRRDMTDSYVNDAAVSQDLMSVAARCFAYQRIETGEDSYDEWDPPTMHTVGPEPPDAVVEESIKPVTRINPACVGALEGSVEVLPAPDSNEAAGAAP